MVADSILPQRTTLYEFQRYAKLKPHSIVTGKRFVKATKATQTNANSLSNLEKGASGQYNGYMSPATRRKVKGIVENFLTAIQLNTDMQFPTSFPSKEVYPTFVTLTLPSIQVQCDNVIKKDCFFRFMEYLQREWNVRNYIWVAETQQNMNIHFHVIIDRGLPADRLNQEWNRHLERHNYVSAFRHKQNYIYQNGFFVRKAMLQQQVEQARKAARAQARKYDRIEAIRKEKKRQLRAYERGVAARWSNPPSTKIHSIQNIKKLTAYVAKYMTKEPELVHVPLQPNQTLTQEDGKYFITTTTIEQVKSYKYTNTPDGRVQVEETLTDRVVEEKQETLVKFNNRRLRGRIWGASQALHSKVVAPPEVVFETFTRYEELTVREHMRKVQIYVEVGKDLLGKPIYQLEYKQERVFIECRKEGFERQEDQQANLYLKDIEFAVPAHEIKRATAKAGLHFIAQGGRVIPLSTPQKDLLPAISPPMWARYRDHYRMLFAYLYPDHDVAVAA